jgi:predicted dehydrogenase
LDNVTLAAIADHDPAGLRKAAERSGAPRQYLDYRELLEKEKPDLVSIAPRHPDCHKEMALAAIAAGASLFMEKPMTESPAEADAILAAAEKKGVKLCIAHNRRWTSEFVQVKALVAEGLLGKIREVRIQGKQDSRAGGEDLIVLGTHDFDLMRFYFGDPLWCFAQVLAQGRDAGPQDVHRAQEPLLVAGDTIRAMFAFPANLMVRWDSVNTGDQWNTRFSPRDNWAFEIFGTQGIIAYQSGFGFAWLNSPFLAHKDNTRWQDLPKPKNWPPPSHELHPIKSLIHALETNTQPVCSGSDGRWTVEMVAAIYQSHKARARVSFPLTDREHPLRNYGKG